LAWYYIYYEDTGRMASETTFPPPPLPGNLAYLTRETRADLGVEMWDETARNFVPRPVPVILDRLMDLVNDAAYASDFRTAWNGLTAANKTRLRDALIRLLGPYRYRESTQPIELQDNG